MTHRWDSSARPLFVKTVYVNGSRHAILSQEDPLLQPGNLSLRRQCRPDSSLSFTSTFSTNSSEYQGSGSEMTVKFSKSPIRRPRSKDLSSELQRCLVKLQFASSVQEKQEPETDKEKFYDFQNHKQCEEDDDEISVQKRRKKLNQGKVSNKRQEDPQNYYEKSMRENIFSECQCKSSSDCNLATDIDLDKEKKNYCFMKFTSKPSQFTLNCSCEKNWHNANNFVSFNDSINSKKAKGVLSSTFYNLIFPTKSNEIRPIGRSDDYFYALSNPNSCELYWNNYLAKSFNNSLSERVIQWMDLKRKQKKHDQKFQLSIEEVSLDSTERIFSGKTFIDKITPNKCPEDQEQEPRKSVPNEKESGARKTASAKYRNTETNKGKDEINKVPSTERKDIRKPDCHNKVKADKKNLSVDEKEAETLSKNPISENRSNESATISISAKIDPNLWETDNLQNSIASYLQFPIPETSKLVVSAPEFKSAFPVKSIIPKKMARDSYNGFFQKSKNLFSRWESDTDEEKDFNIKAMKVLEKNNFSGKIKKSETVGTLDGYVDVAKNATKLPKSEFKETSIGKSNAPEENLLSQRHNDLFSLSESRKNCPMEKNLGRPQLHIFIPSLSSRDKVEESLSECESFLNETY